MPNYFPIQFRDHIKSIRSVRKLNIFATQFINAWITLFIIGRIYLVFIVYWVLNYLVVDLSELAIERFSFWAFYSIDPTAELNDEYEDSFYRLYSLFDSIIYLLIFLLCLVGKFGLNDEYFHNSSYFVLIPLFIITSLLSISKS